MHREILPTWKGAISRQKRKVLCWFGLYVYGREFELETDHKPLKHIYNTSSKPSARTERWVVRLQGYNCKVITYRSQMAEIQLHLCL